MLSQNIPELNIIHEHFFVLPYDETIQVVVVLSSYVRSEMKASVPAAPILRWNPVDCCLEGIFEMLSMDFL